MTQSSEEGVREAGKAAISRQLSAYAQRVLAQGTASRIDILHTRKYAVISTPRVGSSVFCRKLEATGALGWPVEWFNDLYIQEFNRLTGSIKKFQQYIDLIVRGTATANGIFGVNFHVHQYQGWLARGIDLLSLGFTKVYLIERKDKVAQAYSYAKGLKTGLWSKEAEIAAGFPDGVHINIEASDVANALAMICREMEYCSSTLKSVIDRVYFYEDALSDDFSSAVGDILTDLGQTATAPGRQNSMTKQSDRADRDNCERIRRYFSGNTTA